MQYCDLIHTRLQHNAEDGCTNMLPHSVLVLCLKIFLLCESGNNDMVHSASLCGLTLNGCTLHHG